ncbi:hypothetical protein HYFRA_00000049 [Hymenoscyphus fraxineus]|uniref:Uncharacterized protein n=1 Tax=Hymenoscyphus fraxineus TaxID=746836 RepID=A0A9N9L253_9HELO|nr:hypothetical protein HYFRA_00000049 [Hymenoscyphus fraxineus]
MALDEMDVILEPHILSRVEKVNKPSFSSVIIYILQPPTFQPKDLNPDSAPTSNYSSSKPRSTVSVDITTTTLHHSHPVSFLKMRKGGFKEKQIFYYSCHRHQLELHIHPRLFFFFSFLQPPRQWPAERKFNLA